MVSRRASFLAALSSPGELSEVEQVIKSRLGSQAPVIEEVCTYLLGLGGKRIRPILTLLAARALGMPEPLKTHRRGQQLIEVAAGIELIHMATLLHDDIIDKSPRRRHKESPLLKYGPDSTLLAGDFLLVRAFGLCAHLDRFIIDATERACVALTEGEIIETNLVRDTHSLESCFEIARKKTAALFRLACESAAYLCECPTQTQNDMALFGEKMGVVFQMVDDILDVTADEDLLGKPSGQDLRERKPSLINILWLKSGSPLAATLRQPAENKEENFIAQALAELRASQIVPQARQIAQGVAEEALTHLHNAARSLNCHTPGRQQSSAIAMLQELVTYVMERVQ